MNTTLDLLLARKSVRSFEALDVPEEIRETILQATLRAATAGAQMLYTVIDVRDQGIKDILARTCDHQPFIARAPVVLVFIADCTRWLDIYREAGLTPRLPAAGDLFLAMQDAIIAAQTAATAAEALGLGSCYIGDILENAEEHRQLLGLGPFLVPACMLVAGYPSVQAKARPRPARFDRDLIVHRDRYRRAGGQELRSALARREDREDFEFDSWVRAFCTRKYESDFSREMSRSAELYLSDFRSEAPSLTREPTEPSSGTERPELPAGQPDHTRSQNKTQTGTGPSSGTDSGNRAQDRTGSLHLPLPQDLQKEEWEQQFSDASLARKGPGEDDWLSPWTGELSRLLAKQGNAGLPVLDLGCGSGSDSEFLSRQGIRVIACDYSPSALALTAARCPGIETRCLDLRTPLPFPDASAVAVVADLSLHYFDEATTRSIIKEVDRVLVPEGLLLVRVNSVRDRLHGAGEGEEIEPHFYRNGHTFKRFFDAADLGAFFLEGRRVRSAREAGMTRYAEKKVLWELVAEKAGPVPC